MSLRTGLLLALAYVLLLAIVALEVPLGLSVRDRVDAEVSSQARSQADVLAASSAEAVAAGDRGALNELAARVGASARGRALLTDAAGRVLADSGGGGSLGDSYRSRPEIARALSGSPQQVVRHSDTLGTDLLATAVPVIMGGRPIGAARITQDIAARNRSIRRAWGGLALVGLLVLGLGLAAGALIASRVARPVRRLERAAARVAAGDLDARAVVEGSSEQRALAREFNTMTERLGRLLRSQQEFVADASHQLRTPLAGLRLRIEEARAETSEPVAREELDAALREVDRLAQMVAELLELSRVGERELPGERVELGEAARRAAQRWTPAAQRRGQRVDVVVASGDGGGAAWIAHADLDGAIDAVVENALHYSGDGATVTLDARPGAIDVLDEGPGFADGEAEAVFERFHRGSAGRRGPGGTGLGLPIARELVRRWGGDVDATNRPAGGGGRVRLTLPPPDGDGFAGS